MNKSFAALAINFVGFQLLWFVAVYGAAKGWGWAAWLVLAAMQLGVWVLNRRWRQDLTLLAAGAVACVLFEPIWMAPGLIEYVDWPRRWVAPAWIWALWLGFAVSFNYCLAWLRPKLLLAALFGAFGGVFSVTVGINFGAATTPQGWWLLALSYGAVWSMVVPALAYLARRLDEERDRYA
ncbi:MAG: DUF2878 domain-containing protein [Alloalcanivorax venustensis]|jgi:hypothetical protein|uniref:DUF2878 domain-containing protein n=1 Tax=Alloalcanivorax venustensis TaxID=172371 RepID=UPI0030011360